jgi:hypothetical protein
MHHTLDQYVHWRHTWQARYDNGNVAECEALEYRTDNMISEYARSHPDHYLWLDGTPWSGATFSFHSRTALYTDQKPTAATCPLLGDIPCYYDNDERLGRHLIRAWISSGCDDQLIWTALQNYNDR